MRVTAIITVLVLMLASCVTVELKKRDDLSIENWRMAKLQYQEDIARAAGVDDPAQLTEAKFPVGRLSWDEYAANLATYDAWIDYEASKADPAAVDNRGGE